jgi:hypothetical protein
MMELKAAYLLMGYMIIGALVEAVLTNESGATAVLVMLLYLSPHISDKEKRQERFQRKIT